MTTEREDCIVQFSWADGQGDYLAYRSMTQEERTEIEGLLEAAEEQERIREGWYIGPLGIEDRPHRNFILDLEEILDLDDPSLHEDPRQGARMTQYYVRLVQFEHYRIEAKTPEEAMRRAYVASSKYTDDSRQDDGGFVMSEDAGWEVNATDEDGEPAEKLLEGGETPPDSIGPIGDADVCTRCGSTLDEREDARLRAED